MSDTQTVRRGRSLVGLVVLAVVAAGLVALVVVAVRGEAPPTSQAQRAHQIASTLRCPICEDLSVADSPAPLAGQMRQQISEQLAAGRSAEQIRAGFVAAYGDSVLLTPPHRGIGQIAYLLPFLVLVAGLAAATLLLRGWRRRPAVATSASRRTGAEQSNLTAADRDRLEDALTRLREEEP
ncbi:MAG TPA: cytochrome c-type biogenesis protein CcmH [Mycobacteriales bacterium]